MTVVTAVVVGLVLASALFVAAELAFVATGRHRLEERAHAGDRRATHAVAVQRACRSCSAGTRATVTAGERLATDVGVFEVSAMDGYRITELALRARRRSPA